MDKVFEIYLAKQDQPENGAYAEVSFPATAYQMQDAFDKLRLAEGEQPYWEITEYHKFEELSTILNDTCGLNDLNALAQRLSELDERQCTAFAGLLTIERESGVLVERTADHPGGYAEQRDELRQVYKTLDLTPKKPAYTILEETCYDGSRVEFPYPANVPVGTEPVRCLDCAVPSLVGLAGGMETVDLLARRLAGMEPETLSAYKALLELCGAGASLPPAAQRAGGCPAPRGPGRAGPPL